MPGLLKGQPSKPYAAIGKRLPLYTVVNQRTQQIGEVEKQEALCIEPCPDTICPHIPSKGMTSFENPRIPG